MRPCLRLCLAVRQILHQFLCLAAGLDRHVCQWLRLCMCLWQCQAVGLDCYWRLCLCLWLCQWMCLTARVNLCLRLCLCLCLCLAVRMEFCTHAPAHTNSTALVWRRCGLIVCAG